MGYRERTNPGIAPKTADLAGGERGIEEGRSTGRSASLGHACSAASMRNRVTWLGLGAGSGAGLYG